MGPSNSKLGKEATAKRAGALSLGQGCSGRAETTGRVRLGSEAFTQLLHEDPSHLLWQNPAGVDEARQVTSCTELHDEVDVVIVPLWLEAEGQLEDSVPSPAPLGGVPTPGPHLEVFQLHNVGVSNALKNLNLCQEVFHRCLVQTLLGHALYSYHFSSVLLRGQEI